MNSIVIKSFLFFSFLGSLLLAKVIHPNGQLKASGNVVDMVCKNGLVVVGTDAGKVDIFHLKSKKKIALSLPDIEDFYGDPMLPKIFSVDFIDQKANRILVVVEATGGNRRLLIIDKKNKINELVSASASLFIRKARFVDKEKVLIALMSSELILKDISNNKILYSTQISQSLFSDFDMNSDHTQVGMSSESGEIEIIDILSGKIIKTLKKGNLDNVYKTGFNKNKIITAGQDRKSVIYDLRTGQSDSYESQFLVYAAAMNNNETVAAFSSNEMGYISIINVVKKAIVHTLVGQESMLNTIVFIDDKNLISSSDDPNIKIWSLP